MKRLLSIWLRNWPIQRLRSEWLRATPDRRTAPENSTEQQTDATAWTPGGPEATVRRPIILWQNDPRRGRLVVACCSAARQLGVRCGIAIAQATELVHAAGPNAVQPTVLEHDPIADSVALERLTAALQHQISPLVAIETLDRRLWAGQTLAQADTVFCDLEGVTHLFGNERGVLEATHQCLATQGIKGKLAVAPNAAAAWAHAHYNPAADFLSQNRLDDLRPLSVNALRLESETRYTLDRLGIESIGSLLRLPKAGLASRLGENLVRRIAEIEGELDVPLRFHHADPQYGCEHELEYATDDLEIIMNRLQRLTDQLVNQLSRNQRGALRLGVRLDLQDHPPLRPVIGLFAPTLDREHLACLIHAGIESLKIPAPITRIRLQVLQSGPLRVQQNSLFAEQHLGLDNQAVADSALAKLVDSLTSRLGREAVLGVRLSQNPLPERAYRTYSLTDHRTRRAIRRLRTRQNRPPADADQGSSGGTSSDRGFRRPNRNDARRRPLKLLRRPVNLTPVNTAPDSHRQPPSTGRLSDAPRAFRIGQRIHHLEHFWGPERIETGWWDGPSVRRDYFRVETEAGYLWWIFRDLKTGNWYLHGRFA